MVHFNIGQKVEINPFDNVQGVILSDNSRGQQLLQSFLDNASDSVDAKKINGQWRIVYSIQKLDFTTILKWIAPYRGVFYYKGASIHFLIENEIMTCW